MCPVGPHTSSEHHHKAERKDEYEADALAQWQFESEYCWQRKYVNEEVGEEAGGSLCPAREFRLILYGTALFLVNLH